jgi:thymidylate synthase (FAD)
MDMKIPVLDHGFVEYIDHMGDDLRVVNAARVSFAKESKFLSERDEGLIRYLSEEDHWAPFAHPHITIRIKAPISIRTQLVKSRVGLVESEVSRRYIATAPEFYMPQWRTKPTNGAKQGSGNFFPEDLHSTGNLKGMYYQVVEMALKNYQFLLDMGVAPEQARLILPQGMYTEWIWTGSLYAFARVHRLRSGIHAQWESREYAAAISKVIEGLFPVAWKQLLQPK